MIRFFTLSLFCLPLIAAPFSEKTFKYQKDVSLPKSSETLAETRLARIVLDEEIYHNSFYGDLRLVAGESPIPYTRKTIRDKNREEEQISIKVLHRKVENEETIYVLELPKLPKDSIYTNIEVEGDSTYEVSLQVSTGPSPKQWSFSTNVFLFDYGNESQKRITIGPTKHRFIRIIGPYNSSLRFSYGIREKIKTNAYWLKDVEVNNAEVFEDKSTYSFANNTKSPFTSLRFYFKEPKFKREIRVEEFRNERHWETVFEGLVFHDPDDEDYASVPLNQMVSSSYRVTITNGDNPPLHLNKMTQSQEKEELVFFVPIEENAGIKLYYGNRYAHLPHFDSNFVPESYSEKPISLYLSPQVDNPNFSFSIVEPPVSGYIANGIFYMGIILLLLMGIKLYKSMERVGT